MVSWGTLSIAGYRQNPVPNTFIKQKSRASLAALVLPGWGYTVGMPLLFYATETFVNQGVDVLHVEYAYNKLPEFAALDSESRDQWLFADVTAAYHALCEQCSYRHIVLIGKSLGTLAMGHLLATQTSPSGIHAIWLTPLVKHPTLRAQIKAFAGHALLVIGTADSHYDADCLADIGETASRHFVVVEGANHSMSLANDVRGSIQVLARVMEAVEAFADQI